jgi:Uma2 family endonuclease
MSTAVQKPVPITTAPPEPNAIGSIILRHVPWPLYVALRDEEDNNHVRMTYDRGRLELMAPARRHERPFKLLAQMVQAWTEERGIPRSTGGPTTLRREDLSRGAEPDESFHIQHEADVRAVEDLRLPDHPPPDLIIESDSTASSIPRLPIFAALGVPEVWRWKDGVLQVLHLEGEQFVERPESRVLPGFPFDEARRLIALRSTMSETDLIRAFREHVRGSARGADVSER